MQRLFVALCGALAAGCGVVPKESVYWHFGCGKAGSISQEVPYEHANPRLQLAPMQTVPVLPRSLEIGTSVVQPCAQSAPLTSLPMPRSVPAADIECTLEKVCKRLEMLEARVSIRDLLHKHDAIRKDQ